MPFREQSFVVSITSFGDRVGLLGESLRNIAGQSRLPEAVHLNLPERSTEDAKFLQNLSLPFELVVEFSPDIGPAMKLIPTAKRGVMVPIITLDDDIAYPADRLESLLNVHQQFPDAVVSHCARLIPPTRQPWIIPYQLWPKLDLAKPQSISNAIPLGREGVLYPAERWPPGLFEVKRLERLYRSTDDLWFWGHFARYGIQNIVIGAPGFSPELPGPPRDSLWESNKFGQNNQNLRRFLNEIPWGRALSSASSRKLFLDQVKKAAHRKLGA